MFKKGIRLVAEGYGRWLDYCDRAATNGDAVRAAYMQGVSETYSMILDELLGLLRDAPNRERKPKGEQNGEEGEKCDQEQPKPFWSWPPHIS